jgi:hypothetical protein
MIPRLKRFAAFWYDFVVGDDWRVAAGVVIALAITSAATQWESTSVWWIVPLAVVLLLPLSLASAIRRGR